jgi:general secretion pathway protein B
MSSILDALKKSERQRNLGRDLIFRNASPDASVRLTGFAMAVLAALLVLAVALAALLFSLREPELSSPTATTSAETPNLTTDRVAQTAEANLVTSADPVPATRTEAARSVDNKTLSTSRTVVPMTKPVTTKPLPSLDTPRTPIQPPPVTASGDVPWLSSLPASFRSNLPPLSVNIHVYSPEESQRILYINNRPARQGERIEGGVVVEEIVHDGVVLQFRGQRFKLPRPS